MTRLRSGTDELADRFNRVDAEVMDRLFGEVGPGSAPTSADELPEVKRIGRHLVVGRLGAGGMGLVYAAYDPRLDRKIAIKLISLRPTHDTAASRARMLREAQALARLAHPNVVAVHDAGVDGEQVWIAMELVEGQTLNIWASQRRRRWQEKLRVLHDTALGVAAAHAAGLVHRDLKPENVMVGRDGRVRVMDFGLAHDPTVSCGQTINPGHSAPRPDVAAFELRLTPANSVLGTPGYIAPEQRGGGAVEAAADQFGWSVMAWELFYGERPSAGLAGPQRAPPRGSDAPGWIRQVIARGLSADPASRYSSMQALLAELRRGQIRSRLRGAAVLLGIVALIAVSIRVYQHAVSAAQIEMCQEQGAGVNAVWNHDVRTQVHGSILATGAVYAPLTADRVVSWLDEQAQRLRGAQIDACMRSRVEGVWRDALPRVQWCLDEGREEFAALVAELTRADGFVVQKAVWAVLGLPQPGPCMDTNRLAQLPMPAQEQLEDVRRVRSDILHAVALERAGKYDEGLVVASASVEAAKRLGWSPLVARANLHLGSLLQFSGKYADAETALESAFFDASRAGASDTAANASRKLVSLVGRQLARHTDGLRWARHGELALAALGDPDDLRAAELTFHLAGVYRALGDPAEAKRLHEDALAIRERVLGPEHPDIAASFISLGNILASMGENAEAKRLHERALHLQVRTLGPDHPDLLHTLNNLGSVNYQMGEFTAARALLERALSIGERTVGPDHPDLGNVVYNLGNVHKSLGDALTARRYYERSLALRSRSLGSEHPLVAFSTNGIGLTLLATGELAAAKQALERAVTILEKALRPDHPDIAPMVDNLGNIHRALEDPVRGRELHERALRIREAALGPDHPDLAKTLINLADSLREAGQHADARRAYERARIILETNFGLDHHENAASFFGLALLEYDLRQYDRAGAAFEQALSIRERALGSDHPDLAKPLLGLADVSHAEHRGKDAISLVERVMNLRGLDDTKLAEARYVLAQILWDVSVRDGRDRKRALELARQAHATLSRAEGKDRALGKHVADWLGRRVEQ